METWDLSMIRNWASFWPPQVWGFRGDKEGAPPWLRSGNAALVCERGVSLVPAGVILVLHSVEKSRIELGKSNSKRFRISKSRQRELYVPNGTNVMQGKISRNKSVQRKNRNIVTIPQVTGKTIERIEVSTTSEYCGIEIRFTDKQALNFEISALVAVTPRYGSWKTGDWTPIRAWKTLTNCWLWCRLSRLFQLRFVNHLRP